MGIEDNAGLFAPRVTLFHSSLSFFPTEKENLHGAIVSFIVNLICSPFPIPVRLDGIFPVESLFFARLKRGE